MQISRRVAHPRREAIREAVLGATICVPPLPGISRVPEQILTGVFAYRDYDLPIDRQR